MYTHAYTAGLIDGEGSILLQKCKASAQFRFPFVSMTSTAENLCVFLKETYGGHISRKKTYEEHHKQAWHWAIQNNKALVMLELLQPYLREPDKVYRTNLLLNEYKKLTVRNGKYSESQKQAKWDFEYRFLHPSDALP